MNLMATTGAFAVEARAPVADKGAALDLEERFTIADGQSVELGVCGGDLRLTDGPGIAATVTGVEQLGTESYLHCRTSLDEPITVHQRCQTTTKKRKSIILSNDARALRVFDPETGQSCLKCKVPPYRA